MAFGPKRRETVTFRDAPIIFKNFTGEKRDYNAEGSRNFSILMDEATALDLMQKSWNVKALKRRDDDEEQLYHLKVKVAFGHQPPKCWLVSSGGRVMLGESMIGMFDKMESVRVDLVISAYDWSVNGNTGRAAYLQTMFFHAYEDELEIEYAGVPQIPAVGENMQLAIEPGSQQAYEYEGEVVEEQPF